MLLTDITKIIRVLLGAFGAVASQDELTQRRIGQIGEVIGAVEDVSATEAEADKTIADKRVEEAHDIIHRVAAILAMEENQNEGDGGDGGGGGGGGGNDEEDAADTSAGPPEDEPLKEVPWDGTLEGETIELKEDDEE